MSTATFTIPLIVVIPGQVIAASLWNGEFLNIFTNLNPLGVGAYSDTDPQMQTSTDPFPSGTSRPTSLAGELERLRYILNLMNGQSFWYQHPGISLATLNTLFPGGLLNGTSIVAASITNAQIAALTILAANIANNTITNAQIANNTIGAAQIANNSIGASQITNASITETQLAASVAGNGLGGGAGSPLAVNVDGSTIQISADTLSAVTTAIGMKSINSYTINASTNLGDGKTKTFNQAITSVNTAKAVAVLTSVTSSANADGVVVPGYTLSLTSATNLRLVTSLLNNPSGTDTWAFVITVIEFN